MCSFSGDRAGYEQELLVLLTKLVRDMDRKIERQKERAQRESEPRPVGASEQTQLDAIKVNPRLKFWPAGHCRLRHACRAKSFSITGSNMCQSLAGDAYYTPGGRSGLQPVTEAVSKLIGWLWCAQEKEKEALEKSEKLAEEGDVDGSILFANQAEGFKQQWEQMHTTFTQPERTMTVCDICGVFINSTDNEQRRKVCNQLDLEPNNGILPLQFSQICKPFSC